MSRILTVESSLIMAAALQVWLMPKSIIFPELVSVMHSCEKSARLILNILPLESAMTQKSGSLSMAMILAGFFKTLNEKSNYILVSEHNKLFDRL